MLLRATPLASSVGGFSTTTIALDLPANGDGADLAAPSTPTPTRVTCSHAAHRTDCAFPAYASVSPHPPHWQCASAAFATFTVAHKAHRTLVAPLSYAKRTRHPAQSSCDVRDDVPPPSGTAVTVAHNEHRTFEAPCQVRLFVITCVRNRRRVRKRKTCQSCTTYGETRRRRAIRSTWEKKSVMSLFVRAGEEKRHRRRFVYTCRERAANAPSSPWAYLGVHQQRAAPFARASGAHDAPGVAALACARKGRGSASEPGSRAVGVTPRWRGMASFRGDEAWTARRRAGAGYARRHAPECDAPMLEVARSVHLSTWPPCIVPPCAARSEIEVAATEVVLNAGAEILVRKRARTEQPTSFLTNPALGIRKKDPASVEFPVRDSSLFFFPTDVVGGKTSQLVADGVCAKFAVGA